MRPRSDEATDAIDILPECVFGSAHRHHVEEKRSSMLVEAAIFAPKTTDVKTSTAKGGPTR
jgi:hypothetical protein